MTAGTVSVHPPPADSLVRPGHEPRLVPAQKDLCLVSAEEAESLGYLFVSLSFSPVYSHNYQEKDLFPASRT